MTAGSIQRMLNTLQQLHRHVAPGVLPARTGGRSWELTPAGTFVDIGSGYGKVRPPLEARHLWRRGVVVWREVEPRAGGGATDCGISPGRWWCTPG
jgi:hypothetical protein